MKRIATAVLLYALAAPAFAEGMYAGVNVGQNKYDDPTLTENTTTAFGILGGYFFNENFAAEAAYTNLGSLDITDPFFTVTLKGNALSLSGVGSFPINDQFSLFARLGLAQTKIEATGFSESKSGATFGIGGQFNASRSIGIRFGFDRYKVGETQTINADVMSIGAVFNF